MELKSIKLKGAYEIRYYAKSLEVYDEKGNMIYHKRKYNEKGNMIYYENSNGEIIDKRTKELTIEQIENLLGYKIKIKGEQ